MEVYEISGFQTGIDRAGVNFLDPADAFEILKNGYIYRQELQSRKGFQQFSTSRMPNTTGLGRRIMGIFENTLPDGSLELLVIDKNFLYKYSDTTDTFTVVPFNSADPIPATGFAISDNDEYVSGTSYFTKTGTQRFIFTGKGMSDIYFYDGTDVKRFTNVVDNPDYEQPPEGALTKASFVLWFGERLNLFQPVIGGLEYSQGFLYSAIRNVGGNGDKFNVSGAGILSADTYEYMNGTTRLGDNIVMNFNRSNWLIEKTRDVFNPYFIRKIPSVLGTDAAFSGVSYNYEVKSVGKTGLITTDGRESLRFDSKLPYFTQNEIDSSLFTLTYGGFDRENAQFLFAYRNWDSDLTDQTQDKVLVYNYEEKTWSINDQRFSVFGQAQTGISYAMDQITGLAGQPESWARMDTTTETFRKLGIGLVTQKTLAGDNEGFVYEINLGYNDYFVNITGITQAANAVLTVSESAFRPKDVIYIQNVEGMTEINGKTVNVISATNTTVTIDLNTTDFSAYTGNGTIVKTIDFEGRLAPFNPYRANGRKCFVSHIELLLNTFGESVFVDIYEDGDENGEDLIKSVELVPNNELATQRQWLNLAVCQESDFLNVVLRKSNAIKPIIISAIRIHCKPGLLNNN